MSRTLSATSSVAVTVNWYVSCVSRSSFLLTVITPLQETPQQLHIHNQHMTQHPSNPAVMSDRRIRQTQLPYPTVGSVRPNCPVRPSDQSDPTALSDRRIRHTQLPCPTVGSVRPNCRLSDQSDPTAVSDCRIRHSSMTVTDRDDQSQPTCWRRWRSAHRRCRL